MADCDEYKKDSLTGLSSLFKFLFGRLWQREIKEEIKGKIGLNSSLADCDSPPGGIVFDPFLFKFLFGRLWPRN